MKKQKILRIFALAIAFIMMTAILASCSAKALDSSENVLYDENVNNSGSSSPSYEYKDEAGKEEAGEGADINDGSDMGEYEPKIIRTANVNAETRDFNGAVAEIERRVGELGGYIENCNIQNMNQSYNGGAVSNRYANYVLRIPAEKLDSFLAETGELLNVTSSSSSATDISGEYYDIQARISVLETERQLLEKMLSEATSLNNMLTLEERLYDVIYEIESYKTAIKVYDSKVAYSTVNLTVREVANLTPLTEDNTFGARFKKAVTESWNNTIEFAKDLVIFLVYVAPALVVMGIGLAAVAITVLIVVKIIRRRVRKNKESV